MIIKIFYFSSHACLQCAASPFCLRISREMERGERRTERWLWSSNSLIALVVMSKWEQFNWEWYFFDDNCQVVALEHTCTHIYIAVTSANDSRVYGTGERYEILTFKYHMLDHFGSFKSLAIDLGFSRVKSRFCLDLARCCSDHATLLSSLRRLWWWCDGEIDRFAIDRCSIW